MVILRSSGSVSAEPVATPKRRSMELDTSSEFLSLLPASQRKSTRLTRSSRALDDSFSSTENNTLNGHVAMKQDEGSGLHHSLRTRGQRVKLEVSFTDMEPTTSSPVNEDKAGGLCTRKSSRLQREGQASSGKQQADVPEEVEASSTPRRSRFSLQSREVEEEEEEEDRSVRRSSRITRYKLDSRNQSVLYDRLITNTAEAVLQKMDDMQKMRRRLRSKDRDTKEEQRGVYTRGQMLRSLRTNVESKDTKENQGEDEDDHDEVEEEDREDEEEEEEEEEEEDDDDDEDGEDEEEENQRRYDLRQRKTVVRYQAPLDEPREPRKRSMYFKDHSSPTRRRFRFSSTAPRSPYNRRRTSRNSSERRRHAIHSSDSTSSSSDDEKFQRRRSKNRSRSVNRCLPMNLVKEDLLGIHKDRMKIGASLADVDPMHIDRTVHFDSIGGLSRHISALKEMVVFPLLYPEVFERFKIQPPRGCLFYGPPGTGKTLVARALANECSQGERRVSFFMRKGADCLSKWVGESERQLRLLFDQAYQMRPSIIFFDEIDGLAPVRSSRQDQIHRAVVSPAKALIPAIRPLLSSALQNILHTVGRVFPHAEQGLKRKREHDLACGVSEDELMLSDDEDSEICSNVLNPHSKVKTPAANGLLNLNRSVLSQPTSYRPRLLLEGRPGSGQSSHLAPAVLHALEKFTVYTLDMAVLFGASATAPEETCAQIFVEAKRTAPSILYIPHIGQWWETVGPALRATFLSLLSSIPAFSPILLLATCNLRYDQLSMEVQELFRVEYGEVFYVQVPTSRERRNFFEDLMLNQAAKAPPSKKKAGAPCSPPPPPRQLTEEETQKLEEQEENTLRELRLFLRDVTNRLSQDKRFKAFTKPVDLDEVPDYAEVIKKPMDLSTVISKIDLHQYETVKEFLRDVDLIWQNALEYNPDRDPSDRQIRHRACALKDTVHAIITDELDEDFEKICEEIKASRSTRGCSTSQFAPSFYHVLPKQHIPPADTKITDVTPRPAGATSAVSPNTSASTVTTPKNTVHRKKRRKSRWSTGLLAKKKSSSSLNVCRDDAQLGSDEDEEDGDDEEEAEKETVAERDEGTGGEEDSMVIDVEEGPAETEKGGSGPTVRKQDSQKEEGTEQGSQAAEDKAVLCENGETETDNHMQKEAENEDKSVTYKAGNSEENNTAKAMGGDENSESILENTNKDSCTDKVGDTQRQTSTVESGETKLTETDSEKCQTGRLADDRNNKVATAEDAELKSHAEPMEVEATETSTTDASAAVRGEEDTNTERSARRMTRALKNAVLQQQMIDVDKALQILDQEIPPLVVDRDKLKDLLERVVTKTEGYEVYKLEKLYALLCQSIYRHRRDFNKTALIQVSTCLIVLMSYSDMSQEEKHW
ncbi:hypothetical protein INR49_012886 [Caranx melampygus]|nr:hypothetical protein INR49_012886 [Caranx melampygus]